MASQVSSREAALGQYSAIDWDAYGKVGILAAAEVKILRTAEAAPLDYALGDHAAARKYVRSLHETTLRLKVVGNVSDVAAQQYALTKIEEILLAEDCGALQSRVKYFLTDEGELDAAPFMRSLQHTGDAYCSRVAASVLATLLTAREGASCEVFVSWLCEQLQTSRSAQSDVKAAVPALTILLRNASARDCFTTHGGVGLLTKLLKPARPAADAPAGAASAQLLYELTFCLWTLSFGGKAVADNAFVTNATVDALCDQVTAAPREKVVRVSLAALRNIVEHAEAGGGSDGAAARMLKRGTASDVNLRERCGLQKTLSTFKGRPWADPDVADDVEKLAKVLAVNYRELSTFERYADEVESKDLQWGLVHSEKFWRENARAADRDDFKLVKKLVQLLASEDSRVVAIACYDIGEFVRFYPNGKAVVKHLGAKDRIMGLIDHADADVQRHALQCVSKILVTNWEFVK